MKFFKIKVLTEAFRLTANYPGKKVEHAILFTLHYVPPNESINLTTLHSAIEELGLPFDFAHVLVAADSLYTNGDIEAERREEAPFIRISRYCANGWTIF